MRKLSLPLRPLTPRTEGRTQTAERIDRLGLSLLAAAVCAAFFYWLWRSAGPALLAGGASVAEVADRVGYDTDYSFRRAFQRYTGVKAQDYTAEDSGGKS